MTANDTGDEAFVLEDDGAYPNSRLPVILHRAAIAPSSGDVASAIEERFHTNGWDGAWRNGIFDFHHYHATAHEALGCARGWVRVMLGGPNGREVELRAGDVVVLPAGTAHRNLGQSADYLIVGAYPPGQSPDMKYGKPEEYEAAKQEIAMVPFPDSDPVLGDHGAIGERWDARPSTSSN